MAITKERIKNTKNHTGLCCHCGDRCYSMEGEAITQIIKPYQIKKFKFTNNVIGVFLLCKECLKHPPLDYKLMEKNMREGWEYELKHSEIMDTKAKRDYRKFFYKLEIKEAE